MKKDYFLEIALEEREDKIGKYIKNSTVEKIVFEDLSQLFPIESTNMLYDILIFCLERMVQQLTIPRWWHSRLIKKFCKKVCFLPMRSLIIEEVETYRNATKVLRKAKKIYAACPSITFVYKNAIANQT